MKSADAFVHHYRTQRSDVDPHVLARRCRARDIPQILRRVLDLTTPIAREPWDSHEVSVLIDPIIFGSPPNMRFFPAPEPARIAPDSVADLMSVDHFWACYAASAQLLSDDHFRLFLKSLARPGRGHDYSLEAVALRRQVTSFDRLTILLSDPYAASQVPQSYSDLFFPFVTSPAQLTSLIPLLDADIAACLIMARLADGALPSRWLLEAFSHHYPDLGRRLTDRSSQYAHRTRQFHRLFLHVPGYAPAILSDDAHSFSIPDVYHPAHRALNAVLDRCDPAVRPLLDNPSASLGEALRAARCLSLV